MQLNRCRTSESGAVLIIALVMLLVMAIIGTSAIRLTTDSERMTGQFFNKQTSFDASESALRAGEAAVENLSLAAPTDGTDGLYLPNSGGVARWENPATSWETRSGLALQQVARQPEYISEYLGGIPRDNNCALDSDTSTNFDCWRYAYRVSSQGWGQNTNSNSVTQSTIIIRK